MRPANGNPAKEDYRMPVLMTLEVEGDPNAMERFAAENQEKMQSVLEAAKRHGLIAHRFYGSDDGRKLIVVDEWPDRESFESFFQEQQSEIGPMFDAVGATDPNVQPSFWRVLETHDKHGWES
jgi:hypothetical protein